MGAAVGMRPGRAAWATCRWAPFERAAARPLTPSSTRAMTMQPRDSRPPMPPVPVYRRTSYCFWSVEAVVQVAGRAGWA